MWGELFFSSSESTSLFSVHWCIPHVQDSTGFKGIPEPVGHVKAQMIPTVSWASYPQSVDRPTEALDLCLPLPGYAVRTGVR